MTVTAAARIRVESRLVAGAGPFPGSSHPARIYRGVLDADALAPNACATAFEALFEHHGWLPAWRAGLYEVHHHHASAHEVLGIFSGWVTARLGGPSGACVTLRAGDAILIPAGVAHCNEARAADFRAVGAYPRGMRPDLHYGREALRAADVMRLRALPAPAPDPVLGTQPRSSE